MRPLRDSARGWNATWPYHGEEAKTGQDVEELLLVDGAEARAGGEEEVDAGQVEALQLPVPAQAHHLRREPADHQRLFQNSIPQMRKAFP